MHRRALLALLERHVERFPSDRRRAERIGAFVRAHPDCFERHCREGHITASAWIVAPDRSHVLLGHHRKLDLWLQLGGHADGDPDTAAVALREAREESGLPDLRLADRDALLDVDIHRIPAHAGDPPHWHHDVRYLVLASAWGPLRRSVESRALRWLEPDELPSVSRERGLLRMARRAQRLW